MIELREWQYNLIKKIEKDNCTNYEVVEIKGNYYITFDDLLDCLDETQNYREYAEEQLIELNNKLNEQPDIEANSLQLSTIKKLNELRIENDELKKTIERIESTLNEDDYDKLSMEGIEI